MGLFVIDDFVPNILIGAQPKVSYLIGIYTEDLSTHIA